MEDFLVQSWQHWTPLLEEGGNYSSLPVREGNVNVETGKKKKTPVNKFPCATIRQRTLTFMRWSTRASSCVLMDSLQYSLSPGGATSRIANSLWNINTAHLNRHETQTSCYVLNMDMWENCSKLSVGSRSFLTWRKVDAAGAWIQTVTKSAQIKKKKKVNFGINGVFSRYTNKNYDVQIFSSWLRWDDDELEIDLW